MEETQQATVEAPQGPQSVPEPKGVQLGEKVAGRGKRDYELSEDAQTKLGINRDYTQREAKPEAAKEPQEKSPKAEDTPKGQVEAKPEKKAEGKEGEKVEEEKPVLDDLPPEKLDEFMNQYEVPEESRDKIKGLAKNLIQFRTATTQRSQQLADQTKIVKALAERLGTDRVVSAIQKLEQWADLPEVRTQLKEGWDGEPFNEFLDAMFEAAPKAKEYLGEQKELMEKDRELKDREEILGLKSLENSPFDYKSDDEITATMQVADDHGVDLATAHKIRLGEQLANEKAISDKKVKALQAEIEKLKKETVELKSNGKVEKKPIVEKKGARVIGFDRPEKSEGFDSRDEGILKKLGI
jgi:hypothetical protein